MIRNVDLVNSALGRIGLQEVLELEELNERAKHGSRAWVSSFEPFLSEYDWSFATRVVQLPEFVLSDEQKKLLHPLDRAFQLPSDFVKLRKVNIGADAAQLSWAFIQRYPYRIQLLNTHRVLATNMPVVFLEYTCNSFDLGQMSPPAAEALTLRLAMYLDFAMKAGAMAQNLGAMYEYARRQAYLYEGSTQEAVNLGPGTLNEIRHEWTHGTADKLRFRNS